MIPENDGKIMKIFMVVFSVPLFLMSLLAALGYAWGRNGTDYIAMTELIAALISLILPVLRYKRLLCLPYWFIIIITANIYIYAMSLYFGFFDNLWWWDEVSHWLSSVIVTMIVFVALCLIDYYDKKSEMSKGVIVSLTFIIGFSFGNVWEVFEGLIDYTIRNLMQYDIFDTLYDIHMDFVGAATMAFIAYLILRRKHQDDIAKDIDPEGNFHAILKRAKERRKA